MTAPSSSPARKGSSGVVIPHQPKWFQRLAAWVIYSAIRVVGLTIRYRWDDQSGHFDKKLPGAVLYCLWHNRLALGLTAYYRYMHRRNPTAGVAAMVSASRDGALLSAILECFKVQPVRGSSSRRGPQALSELTTWAGRGYDLAITPDGPRGPCYHVQDGVISLAKLTGLPIIPFSYVLNWKLRVKSWDRFQIPLPFARCEVRLGKPVRVPRDAAEADRENFRQQLEKTLREMSPD